MSFFAKIANLYYQQKQLIKDYFVNAISDTYIKIYILILVLLNIGIWVFSYIVKYKINEDQIALHYNVDFGIDYYGDINKIFVIPLLGTIIIFVNFILYTTVSYSKDRKYIAHILCSTALTANIILLTAVTLIYLINFR